MLEGQAPGLEIAETLDLPLNQSAEKLSKQGFEGRVLLPVGSADIPAFVKSRQKILFLTGIHAEVGIPLLINLAALNLRKYGLDPKVHKMR